jgi:hypothetical protein
MFVKQTRDRQEEHLKLFHMPNNADFGVDLPEHYGVLTYMDDEGVYHEEKVVSEKGDYARVYDDLYNAIVNGAEKVTNRSVCSGNTGPASPFLSRMQKWRLLLRKLP